MCEFVTVSVCVAGACMQVCKQIKGGPPLLGGGACTQEGMHVHGLGSGLFLLLH